MIEKNQNNLWFRNSEIYINPIYVAHMLETILNAASEEDTFGVYINSNTELQHQYTYQALLKYSAEPFSLRNTGSTILHIRLLTICSAENETEKNHILEIMQRVSGPMEGEYTVNEDGVPVPYSFYMNLKITEPSGVENVNSHYSLQIQLVGDLQVTRKGGAVVSDRVRTYVLANGERHEIVYKSVETSMEIDSDAPLYANDFEPTILQKSGSYPKSISVIYKDDYICRTLRDLANGSLQFEGNPFFVEYNGLTAFMITMIDVYPDREIEQTYFIVNCKEAREKGGYVALYLTLLRAGG